MRRFMTLFDFEGTSGPLQYLGTGIAAMLLKYGVDREAASLLHHAPWMPWNYLDPIGTTTSLLSMSAGDRRFLAVMSLIALPFAWLGLSLTVKRLRCLRAPLSFVIFFFIPYVNLLFFLLLSLLPTPQSERKSASVSGGRIPDAVMAILITLPVCVGGVFLAAKFLTYGMGLFTALPFCIGLMSAVLYSRNQSRSLGECLAIGVATCTAAGVALLCFAFEGLICILMLAPFALTLAALGAFVGYKIQPSLQAPPRAASSVVMLVAMFPGLMISAESRIKPHADEFVVTSSIDIEAPPEVVWQKVVTFSKLDEPTELMFKSGIAYPMRADIEGKGVGAIRYCVFSTGPFIEPITIWDEPRLLEFNVTEVPAPMHELSPYPGLHPPHLHGFFVSRKGHFQLTPLSGGRTRLEGTTWYSHNLWPESYWRLWSDYIVHRIHMRVLEHVKKLSETNMARVG